MLADFSPPNYFTADPFYSMKRLFLPLALLTFAAMERGSAVEEKDVVGPTVTITNPALGAIIKNEKIVVSGTVTDNKQDPSAVAVTVPVTPVNTVTLAGVKAVQYRFNGSKIWHNAILIPGATSTAASTYAFTFRLKKGSTKSVSIRGQDNNKNEGDITTIKVKRRSY